MRHSLIPTYIGTGHFTLVMEQHVAEGSHPPGFLPTLKFLHRTVMYIDADLYTTTSKPWCRVDTFICCACGAIIEICADYPYGRPNYE